MVATPSAMVELGTAMPHFILEDPQGRRFGDKDEIFAGSKAFVVIFMCNHCPYVVHLADSLAAFYDEYRSQGMAMVGINSNDFQKYPADAPEKMLEEAKLRGYEFPYLVDSDCSVAKAFNAACTPDIFVYDQERRLAYRGQFDSTRPGKGTADGEDLRRAVDEILGGKQVSFEQRASIGCNIKWRDS